jgi:hypothetical protein
MRPGPFMKNIPESMIRSLQSRTVADTFAMVTFAFAVGMVVEVVFSGLTLDQSFQSRLLAIPMNMIIAGPYGLYRDRLFSLTGAETGRRITRVLVDIFAFLTFMVPQYAAVLWVVGADGLQILTACSMVTAMSLAVGRPYGLYMLFCRKLLERAR